MREDEKFVKILGQIVESNGSTDCINMDIPLFIRLMEFAREDANSDLDLHFVAENALRIHKSGTEVLGMKNYKELVKK